MDTNLLIHRICKVLHYHHYYETKYGIKEHNKSPFIYSECKNEFLISSNEILLGFDGLKDEYTLLGTPMTASPHAELMTLLNNGKNISNCEYVRRELAGYLDGRDKIPLPNHELIFQRVKAEINTGNYSPALVYNVDGKYYAFDGKHRLALCAVLGLRCKCICMDVSYLKNDNHTERLYKEMKKRSGYNKNLALLDKIFA